MATRIKHKRSAVAGKQPIVSQLESGELAINTADGKIFLLRDDNTVQDVTRRIFDNDTEISIDDKGDSAAAEINIRVNEQDTAQFTAAGMNLFNDLDIEDANILTFKELTASGDDGVGIKAPDTLDAGYRMTLPPSQGTVGQILATDGNGQLFFQDSDIFGGNVVYVSQEQGDDANDGQSAPVKTLKRAAQIACSIVYNSDGTINFKRVNIKVAVGDYTEDNPVIIPDNTVVKGDGLRGCIIRPANANLDMLRVRNACYFGEFTFRDGVDDNFIPVITADYAVAFDDPFATDVTDRDDYPNLPNTRPTIFTSPYIQNASIISFLGMNGAKIDGSKVESPNVPTYGIEAENPVVGAIPEQGKSMVANAFTILSFGGTAWRLTNDAYAQIVSCFEIFLLNGVYCQSGGYCSITNSATNFGLYALRSSGFSPKAFSFDRSFVNATGQADGKQTISIVGINRDAPVEEFVLRFRESDYKTAHDLLISNKDLIAADTVTWINAQISAATPSIWAGFSYNEDKCRRDTRLLLDAIRYDIIFNSNYRTVSAALRYFSGSFDADTFAEQKQQHIEAFGQAKTLTANYLSDATATSRANALWDEIIDIITNGDADTVPGDGVADAYTRPLPTGGTGNASDSGYANAVTQLLNNKLFIQKEITAWIATQVGAGTDPFSTGFVYNEDKCERDTGLIIDALVYDLTYGGNLQTFIAALAYFTDGVQQYGTGQQEETIAAYTRLKEVIQEVILTTAVNVSSGNPETQNTAASAGSTDASDDAGARVQEILDYIESEGATEPTKIEPDLTWVSSNAEYSGYNELDEEGRINIAQNVTQYINQQIQANIWYGFTYNESKCNRDTQLIVDAVAKDTWDTGNRYSRSAGLAYYTRNLQDSTQLTIQGQELQTIAAIEQAKVEALTYINSLSADVQDFAGSRFDIVNTIINDPLDLPDPTEVSSEGDITNDYKTTPTETTFDAATAVNADTDIITIVGHGFVNGQKVIYDPNGNAPIKGLDDEQQYYIRLISEDEFSLCFDDSLDFNVNIIEAGTGTHKFLSGVIEFFVEEILSSHTTYQQLELESGSEGFEFIPGRSITGTTGSQNNSAIVYSWEPRTRLLVVSIELVTVGQSQLRIQFDETSTIDEDHASSPNTVIGVNEAVSKQNLGTATFSVTATDGSSSLTNLTALPEKQCWFHRPSVVNSSAHTWEYAGSGTDYNALPQNGGNTRSEFEQFEELPGRVYSSGTNELGDFKVGDFITAFNRTGNITFRNKVQVDELDALRLSLSDVAIEEISTSVNLGDDEIGGPSDARLPTQLSVRSFISNRLGGFVDKTVSTAAVPGAIVQLNTNGQLNADLIPATRQFTNTNTDGYQSRLEQVDDIPPIDLKAGDIATENYEQVELTLSANLFNAADGDIITQPGVTGARGYAKGNYNLSGNVLVVTIDGAWDDLDDSTGDPWETDGSAPNLFVNGVDSGVKPTAKGPSTEIIDNWFLRSSNSSQFLNLDPVPDYVFTSVNITTIERNSNVATVTVDAAHNLQIGNTVQVVCNEDESYNENTLVISTPTSTTFTYANTDSADPTKASASVTGTVRTIVTSADGGAQGAVTEYVEGIAENLDNANLVNGSGYTPTLATFTYEAVPFQAKTGSGTGAKGNITVTAGQITDVDITRGGSGYEVGDLLEVLASDVGGTGSGFEIEVTGIAKRAYVNILGGELFVASVTSIDFVEDNTAVATAQDINLDDIITHNFLAGTIAGGGAVNYTDSRITIPNHGFGQGDPVSYDSLANTPIGGLLNEKVYYVKVIDANTIELYEGFALLNQAEFTSTPANNNHNITRKTINVTDNSVVVENHGFTTGDAFRMESLEDGSSVNVLPTIETGDRIDSGSRFFVGSVTDNSFTLHTLRSDALNSINDLVTNAIVLVDTGVGTAQIIQNNVQVNSVINTSSRLIDNWNTLAVTNIDAENIISGTVSPSRLGASGVPNSDTALFGDSSYKTVVQSVKVATTTDNPITLTGSSLSGEFYGDPVNIGISNVNYDPLGTFSGLGVSRFLQTQFDIDTGGSGQVFIKDGVVDAGTLDGLDSAYFLNPANLTSVVPVTKGGTALATYSIGDIIYAQSASSLNQLSIGRRNNFLKSNGVIPEWGTALDLAEGLDVGSAALTSKSTGAGRIYNENVTSLQIGGSATNINIGNGDGARDLFPFIASYEATVARDVVVNLENITQTTSDVTQNGENEVIMSDTTGILAGMIVTGSGSIPANTTVSGVTDDAIYLSADTTGSILSATTLSFQYTPFTLGISVGTTVNIASSSVTNLDGTWPVSGATPTATSFTIRTDDLVTALVTDIPAGTHTINNSMIMKNESIIVGNAETSTTPSNAVIKGTNGFGTDTAGGDLTLQAGLGTGNSTGGTFTVKTGETSTTSDLQQTSTVRLTIDTYGDTDITGYTDFTDTTAIKVPLGTTAQRPGEAGIRVPVTTGQIRFNSTDVAFEGYDGTAWATLGGVKDIDQDTFIRAETASGDDNDDLDFFTANVQRMQIDENGDLKFGDALDKVTIAFTTGNTTIAGDLVLTGDLTVNGTTTTLDTTTLIVEDKNIELGNVATPTDITANGGGITLLGDTNHTMLYNVTNGAWEFSESINVANTKVYRVNNSDVLSATTLGSGVVNSSLTTVGTLAAGSIASSFGDINIGTSTFTGNGSGLDTLNASELDSGTVAGARLGGDQTMAGIKTFSDTSAATNTTTGAVRIGGGLGVAGAIYAGSLNTADGSGIDNLSASNLDQGTVPNARITGTYSNLTGTGALDAGSISTGFGNINIGTSTFTGNGSGLTDVDAETLDGIDSASFLRSDTADTMTALLTMSHAGDEMIRLQDTSATGNPYISFYQSTTRAGYIQFVDSGNRLRLYNDTSDDFVDIRSGQNGLEYNYDGTAYTVWHSGNDGAGSGLDADTLDGQSSGAFLRSNANDSFSGELSGAGSINITGNVTANLFTGDGSGLTGISADDANTLDGLDSTQFLRSDANDTASGVLTLRGSGQNRLVIQNSTNAGSAGINFSDHSSGSYAQTGTIRYVHSDTDSFGSGNAFIVEGTESALTFYVSGDIKATDEITAYYSDERLKDFKGTITNALDKVQSLNGYYYTENETAKEIGFTNDKVQVGLSAQEVEAVLPEIVTKAPIAYEDHVDVDYKTVKYDKMVPLLVEAIKEQQTQIDELKAMVQKLLDK